MHIASGLARANNPWCNALPLRSVQYHWLSKVQENLRIPLHLRSAQRQWVSKNRECLRNQLRLRSAHCHLVTNSQECQSDVLMVPRALSPHLPIKGILRFLVSMVLYAFSIMAQPPPLCAGFDFDTGCY
jgi:hypothetical protein